MPKLFNSLWGVRDDLVNPIVVAANCLMADIIHSANKLQTILLSTTLDWYLDDENDDPSLSGDSYFGRLEQFYNVASQSARRRYHNRRFIEFNLDRIVGTFA